MQDCLKVPAPFPKEIYDRSGLPAMNNKAALRDPNRVQSKREIRANRQITRLRRYLLKRND